MINTLLQTIAPHHCYGCTKIGAVLCHDCKYNIADEANDTCLVCALPSPDGICANCQTSYEKAWSVGDRNGVLAAVIDAYKFKRVKSASSALADLLDIVLPIIPNDSVIVPVPTISSHKRVRGYDHTLLIARQLAAKRNITVEQMLARKHSFVQLGKTKKERFLQMSDEFTCVQRLDPTRAYILIDDVVTTNATVRYCAEALGSAGAQHVWVATLARQPLDK